MAVGSIQIDVLANTQKLVSGMKRAESTVANSAKAMTRAVQAFATVFVGGKLIGAINRSSTAIDKLGKTAAKLGIGTEELGALHFAAEQSGVSVETLNMALQRSTRRIAEAAQGTGEAVKALKELGLSAEQLNQLSPDEQLNYIADAMQGVASQSDKVRLSMKLFDSEGVSLIQMFSNSSAGLKAYAAEAASLGILLDESMVKGVEAANDANNRLSKSMGVVAQTINVQLAPYIVYAANALVALIQRLKSGGEASTVFGDIVRATARGFIIAYQGMVTAMDGWASTWAGLMLLLEEGKGFLGLENDIAGANEAFKNMSATATNSFNILISKIDGTDSTTKEFLKTIKSIETSWADVGIGGTNAMNGINKGLKDSEALAKKAETTVGSGLTGAFRSSLDGANSWGDALSGIFKDLIAQMFQMFLVKKLLGGIFGDAGGTAATAAVPVVSGAAATGGTIGKTGSYLVGEKGAEIVTLKGGSNVIPNSDIGGGGATVVNVYNNTSSQVDVQEDEAGKIDIIISTIANQITRGTGVLGTSLENRYNLSKA